MSRAFRFLGSSEFCDLEVEDAMSQSAHGVIFDISKIFDPETEISQHLQTLLPSHLKTEAKEKEFHIKKKIRKQ